MKKLKLKLTLLMLLFFSIGATAQQVNPPIKGVGVVIKKNRPLNYGSKVTANTNEKGETTVKITEKGNYIITVLQPTPSGAAMTETQGQPIRGVKIGLAKHPGNYFIRFVQTNNKGEAEFKDLEPDSYTIKVQGATKDCPPGWYNLNGTCIPNEPRNPNTTTKDYIGHVTLLRYSQWYFGGGLQVPSSTTKTSGIVNSIDLNLGYYHPIWAWDKSNISLGINGELGYTVGNGSYDVNNQYTVYQLVGQTQQPLITENAQSTKSTSFRGGAGLQMNIHLGKLILSPVMNAGYLSTTQKAFSVDETIYPQGGQATYRLLDQKETKTSGLGIFPKLRFTYMLSSRIGVWLEGNYTIGPNINTETTRFVIDPTIPLNNINEGNFQEGKYITSKNETSFSAVGVNGGIVVNLGKPNKPVREKPITNLNKPVEIIEDTFPTDIQKQIDEQNDIPNKTFQEVNNSNQKISSLCNFKVEKVDIECNGKDQQGNKKYKIKIYYKNLSTAGTSSLGEFVTPGVETATNGNYLSVSPAGTATISGLSPLNSSKTFVAPLTTQTISFDFVPLSGFSTITISGHTINGSGSSGGCYDTISLNFPNCCDGCDENKVVATPVSIVSNNSQNSLTIVNSIQTPNDIVRIEADLIGVKVIPNNSDCQKCNNNATAQNNFIGNNQISGSGWANNGKPTEYLGENSTGNTSRSLVFGALNLTGVNLANSTNITHTIGVAPTSCCGDTVEIYIRYTVWDKNCKVCDKKVNRYRRLGRT